LAIMKTAVQTTLPTELLAEARRFVAEGWSGDFDALLAEALRRYLDSHSSQLAEQFVREDVAWGLHGGD
jgi:hypothetical protein